MSAPPVADVAFDFQANGHDPRYHPNIQVGLLADIYRQLESSGGKSIFGCRAWLELASLQ